MKSNRKIQSFADKSLSGLHNETFAAELSQKRAEIEQKELKTHANAQNKTTARKWAFSAVGCLLILIAIIVPCVLVLVPGETDEIPAPPSYGWGDKLTPQPILMKSILCSKDISLSKNIYRWYPWW